MTAGNDPVPGEGRRVRARGADRAETYLRVLAETELRHAFAYPRHEPFEPVSVRRPVPAAAEGINRVEAAADALAAVGAVDEATAGSVVTGLGSALAARSKVAPVLLHRFPLARWSMPQLPAPGLPGGPVRIVPVEASVPAGRDGAVRYLLTLVLAPGRAAALTIAGRMRPDHGLGRLDLPAGPFGPYSLPELGLTFTDDGGSRYQGEISGGGTCDGTWWSLAVFLSPRPPPAVRWLDIAAAGGSPAARVELAGSAATGSGQARPVTPVSTEDAASRAGTDAPAGAGTAGERLLESITQTLLWSFLWKGADSGRERSWLTAMATALVAAGEVQPGSAALGRLAALLRRLGTGVPGEWRAAEALADLPPPWHSVLADRQRRDGREGVAPADAVLPEIDSACFAVTGLYSSRTSATLRALAWGWRPHGEAPLHQAHDRFSWWARDSAGRWHVARETWSDVRRNGVNLDITLVPPLHPAATSLQIILTGRSARATATVPLRWQAAR